MEAQSRTLQPYARVVWRPARKDLLAMVILSLVSFITALDSTVLVTILPIIAHELDGSTTETFWAGTSYLLTSAVSQPFFTALSGQFGCWELLFVSIVVFGAASIVCGLARGFTTLLVGRFLQGVGGGGIITLVQQIFSNMVPLRQRPKWFSIVLATWAIGSIIGPFIGSGLTEQASFHWVFWLNLPFCGITMAFVLCFTRFRNSRSLASSKVDWLEGVTFAISSTSILIGLSWGGIQFSWSSPWTLLPIIAGIVVCLTGTLLSLGVRRSSILGYNQDRPHFFPFSWFRNISMAAAQSCAFLHGLILLCTLYYLPFYFASVRLQSPTKSSACVLPISCSLLPGAAIASQLISHTGYYRWAIWLGWAISAVGAGLLLLLDENTATGTWVAIFLVFGTGNGCLLSAINFSIQAISGQKHAGQAAGIYTFLRSFGMAIGVAVGGNVFQNVMAQSLRESGLPRTIAKDAEKYIQVLHRMKDANGDTDRELQAVLHAYSHGFHGVFLLLLGASTCGLCVGAFIDHYSMDQSPEDDEIRMLGINVERMR